MTFAITISDQWTACGALGVYSRAFTNTNRDELRTRIEPSDSPVVACTTAQQTFALAVQRYGDVLTDLAR